MDIHATIQRLLKMTVANGASIQEAETAAATIRKLLDKHGLTIEEVRARRAQGVSGVEFADVEVPWHVPPTWVKILAADIAAGFDCSVAGGGRVVRFIGFPPEPAVAKYLFEVLARELPLSADSEGRFLGYSGADLRDWKSSFLAAAAMRIGTRLRESRQRTKQTAALIVCKEEAVQASLREVCGGREPRPITPSVAITNLSAAVCGYHAGERVCLDGRPLPAPTHRQQPLNFPSGGQE